MSVSLYSCNACDRHVRNIYVVLMLYVQTLHGSKSKSKGVACRAVYMQKTYWKLNFSKLKYAIFLSAGLCPAPRQGSRPGPKGQTSNQFAPPLAGPDSGQSHPGMRSDTEGHD